MAQEPAYEGISDFIRSARFSAGQTQETLARKAGIGVRTLRSIEGGQVRFPRLETLTRIMAALQIPADTASSIYRLAMPIPEKAPHAEIMPRVSEKHYV